MDGREEVFAAGDVARFPESALGELVRVERGLIRAGAPIDGDALAALAG